MDLWQKMKKEYIAGGTSYRKLSRKYGVSETTLFKRGSAEGWTALRKQADSKRIEKTLESVSDAGSSADVEIYQAALRLLSEFQKSVTALTEDGAMTSGDLKDYGAALKSIKACLDRPTELDIQEQQARIEKLRKDTDAEADSDTEIQIKGWDENWAK